MTTFSKRIAWILCAALFIGSVPGCVGFLAQMSYWAGKDLIDAEYKGLEGQRVAIVCVSDNSPFAHGSESDLLSRSVGSILKERVKEIEVVPSDEIADWIDKNDWDEMDYQEVAKGVKADRIVAIDLSGFKIHDGQSLYRGRVSATVTVFDMQNEGKEVFRRTLPEIKYPVNTVYHSSETTETAFKREFIQRITQYVSRYFYKFDMADDFGQDTARI